MHRGAAGSSAPTGARNGNFRHGHVISREAANRRRGLHGFVLPSGAAPGSHCVMYANTPGARFDHGYYRDKHMSLVKARMGNAPLGFPSLIFSACDIRPDLVISAAHGLKLLGYQD
jgi:hypothetical protein